MHPAEPAPSPPLARTTLNPLSLVLLASVWIATAANWPLWRALLALPEMASTRGTWFMLAFGVMLAALTAALLSLLAWRWTVKPMIGAFLLSAAIAAHFMGTYGVVIDPTMMVNVLQTDVRETRDLLSLRMLFSVLGLGVLPLLALWRLPLQQLAWPGQLLRNVVAMVLSVLLLVALLALFFADMSSTMRNHKSVRYLINPVNAFYSLAVNATESRARAKEPLAPIGLDAKLLPRAADAKPMLLLLVIGETARSDHFSLNGYARATNPRLAKLPVHSFSNVMSCGTNTAASLPCMFSHLGKAGYEARDRDHENLLDLLQRAGLAVLWLDNQSGCKGLCERIPNGMAITVPAGAPPLPAGVCEDGECLDAALLHGIDTRLAALPAPRRQHGTVIVLHQMGSHGPAYHRRSPPDGKVFNPECTTNVLQNCPRHDVVNAYDNSIAYTDRVLAQAIAWLEAREADHATAMLYVSDHGESLGENNLYLHGLPYAIAPLEQRHVPMVLWLPEAAARTSGVRAACVPGLRDAALTHDHLFHTVLGLMGVTASEYRPALDALRTCRR